MHSRGFGGIIGRMFAPRPTCCHCCRPLGPLRQRLADNRAAPDCRHRTVMTPQLQRRGLLLEGRCAAVTTEIRAGRAAETFALATPGRDLPRLA